RRACATAFPRSRRQGTPAPRVNDGVTVRAPSGASLGSSVSPSAEAEYVLRTVEERGVRFVRLWFTDVLGFLKDVEITPAELEGALEEGMTFDGSAIEGYSRVQESDMLLLPDANTFEIVPWHGEDAPTARIFC